MLIINTIKYFFIKNKLHQFLILTLIVLTICISLYFVIGDLYLITLFVEVLAIITAGYLIFADKRNTSSKFAWLFTILFFPYIGIILFFVIGKNPEKRKFSAIQKENEGKLHQFVEDLFDNSDWVDKTEHIIAKELITLSNSHVLEHNQISNLADGEQAFKKLLADIHSATHHIHLFYFIYKDDETGQELANLLIDKVQQGVEVRLMYDSLGSIKLSYDFIHQLRQSGVAIRAYDVVNSPLLSTRINWRNHRKMVVIDGKIAHIGGMNLGNEYRSITEKFQYWRDTNLRINGPAVIEVQEAFIKDWLFLDNDKNALSLFLDQPQLYFPIEDFQTDGDDSCQIICGGPYDAERVLRDVMIELVSKASYSVKIATPYFVPDDEFLSTLRRVSRSGVKVQVIIPGKGDRSVSFHGSNSFIERLLSAGVEVFAYHDESFLHCKLMIIDDVIATVGSTNFDIRSFYLNHELSAIIYGPSESINEIKQQFEVDLTHSNQISVELNQKKSIFVHFKEKISEFFIPLL